MVRPLTILSIILITASVGIGQKFSDASLNFSKLLDTIVVHPELPYINEPIHSAEIVRSLYASNGFKFFWTNNRIAGTALFELQNASAHGLLPNDYHKSAMQRLKLVGGLSANELKMYNDILLTDGILLYAHHLVNGKIDRDGALLKFDLPEMEGLMADLELTPEILNGRTLLSSMQNQLPNFALYRLLYNTRADLVESFVIETDADCLDQIRTIDVNLERLRWQPITSKDKTILVNVADFSLSVLEKEKVTWETRVIVGNCDTPTPNISSYIKYIVFNPTWTVPRSIIEESILTHIQQDADYLTRNSFNLIDKEGALLDPDQISWHNYTIDSINFKIVQAPGANNALGRVKFVFPNNGAIYMHDTPQKELFEQTKRTYSHGCIRVEHPLRLAETLLDDPKIYSAEKINQIVGSGETKTIKLTPPLQVLIVYLTASTDTSGEVVFHEDVYDVDDMVFRLLKRPIK